MNSNTTPPANGERVRISCPGCGRHDWVTWPAGAETLRHKCFNCGKESQLSAAHGH